MAEGPGIRQQRRGLGKQTLLDFRLRLSIRVRRAGRRSARSRGAARRNAGGYRDAYPRHRKPSQWPGSRHELEISQLLDQLRRSILMKGPADFELAQIAPVPRISLQAFCESPETSRIIQAAATDRRMERAHGSVHLGGALGAIEAYRDAPTPNVIVLDSAASRSELVSHIEALAEFCDSGTKVVVVGRTNDIVLYRELIARGISEYLVAPFNVLDFIRAVSHL